MRKFPHVRKKTSKQKFKNVHPKESKVSSEAKCRRIFIITVYRVSVLRWCVLFHVGVINIKVIPKLR